MKPLSNYAPSILSGERENLRSLSFTRWMSPDLLQPASDFLRHLRLLAIYAECSSEKWHRYLLWHPPEGCGFEIRSGRTRAQFETYDRGNHERNWPLLTLQVNESDLYSAVWVSAAHVEAAEIVLVHYGISRALRPAQT